MLHQWIQIAIELRGKLGNLYGFSAVMAGLLTPQVSVNKLEQCISFSLSKYIYVNVSVCPCVRVCIKRKEGTARFNISICLFICFSLSISHYMYAYLSAY